MEVLLGIGILLFGLVIGSFLNVVIVRYNTGRSLSGRSGCLSCTQALSWSELVPVLSFLIQKGRCRHCSSKLSWHYPCVELLTGIMFVSVHLRLFDGVIDIPYVTTLFYWLVITSLFVIIVTYDVRHKIIPDPFVFAAIVFSGLMLFVDLSSLQFVLPSLWEVLSGPLLAAPFALLWLVSRGRWMGLGDAKLAWAVGWLLGLLPGITALVFAFWIGAIASLGLVMLSKSSLFSGRSRFTIQSEVPFAPFIIIGTFIVFLSNMSISTFIGF